MAPIAQFGYRALMRGLVLAALLIMARPAAAQITITTAADMAFGSFAAGSGGSVVVNAAGARSKSGSVVLFNTGTPAAAAQFSVKKKGGGAATYAITLPANNTVVLTKAGGQTMALSAFVSSPSGSGTLNGGTSQTLNVGATLNVANAQAAGAYTGSFAVTVVLQ
jgi:Domain of unknown function (DUF4402)